MKFPGWLVGLLLFASCQNLRQEVEPQQLAEEPVKLIVACFIAPQDTVLAAKVARTRPILDDETVKNLEISNATVTLQTGSRTIVLTYHTKLRYYRASPNQFPIRAGETYRLSVQTPDDQRVEASTTVPTPVDLQRVQLDSALVLENGAVRKRFFARYFWSDAAAQTNYYQTEGTVTYRCPTCSPEKMVHDPVQFVSESGTRALYTDQIVSGNGYIGLSILSNQHFFSGPFSKPFVLTAALLHLNEDFYRYHQALEQQREADGNPFAEPVPIPSNIQGGLGCFGAYNRSGIEITLK